MLVEARSRSALFKDILGNPETCPSTADFDALHVKPPLRTNETLWHI
jgi:hypothetical protein